MASALQWVLKLATGGFTGPALAAAKAVNKLDDGLQRVRKSTFNAEAAHQHAAFRWNKGVKEMTKAQDNFDKSQESSNGGLLEAAGGLAAVEAAALAAGAAIAAVGIALLAKGTSMAIEASAFREQSIIAFETIVGTQREAIEIFNKADALAGKLGLQDEQVVGQLKKLMTSGFSADQSLRIVKAAADLAVVRGEEAAAAFTNLTALAAAKGKFDQRALNQLAKIGIKTEDVYAALAKQLGKTTKEVQALIKAGKIDAADAVTAVTKLVEDRFGGAAEKIAQTVPRLLFRLQDALGDLFNEVDTTALKEALQGALAALEGPAGAKIKEGLNKIFGGLLDSLFGALSPERIEAIFDIIGDALNQIGDIFLAMAPLAQAFIGGMIDAFIEVAKVMRPVGVMIVGLFKELGQSPRFAEIFAMMGKGFVYLILIVGAFIGLIGALLSLFGMILGGIIALVGAVIGKLGSIYAAIVGFVGSFFDAGNNMMAGLADGITSGASSVIQAAVNAAKAAVHAVTSTLGIKSPSKVFEGLGAFTMEGFAAGVANDTSSADAIGGVIEPPSGLNAQQAGRAAGRSAANGNGGGGSVSLHIDQVIIQSSGKTEDYEAGFAAVLEKMRLASGA